MRKKIDMVILLLGVSGVGKTSFVKRILSEPILTLPTDSPEIIKKKLKDIPTIKKYFQFKQINVKSHLIFIDTPGKFKYRRHWRELLQEHKPASIFFFINDDQSTWPEQVSAMEDLFNYWQDAFLGNERKKDENGGISSQGRPLLIKIICNPFNLQEINMEQKRELLSSIKRHFGHVIEAFEEISGITVDTVILSIPRSSITDLIIQIVDVMKFLEVHSLKKK